MVRSNLTTLKQWSRILVALIFFFWAWNHIRTQLPLPDPIFPTKAEAAADFDGKAPVYQDKEFSKWLYEGDGKKILDAGKTQYVKWATWKPRIIIDVFLRTVMVPLYFVSGLIFLVCLNQRTFNLVLITFLTRTIFLTFIALSYMSAMLPFHKRSGESLFPLPEFNMNLYGYPLFQLHSLVITAIVYLVARSLINNRTPSGEDTLEA